MSYTLFCSSGEFQLISEWGWPGTWPLINQNYRLILNLSIWNVCPLDPWLGSIWCWLSRSKTFLDIRNGLSFFKGKSHFLLECDGSRRSEKCFKGWKEGGKGSSLSHRQWPQCLIKCESEHRRTQIKPINIIPSPFSSKWPKCWGLYLPKIVVTLKLQHASGLTEPRLYGTLSPEFLSAGLGSSWQLHF